MPQQNPEFANRSSERQPEPHLQDETVLQDEELRDCQQTLRFLEQIRQDCLFELANQSTNDSTKKSGDVTLTANPASEIDAVLNSDTMESVKKIGRFQIERSIGRGGFAEVFLAQDPTLRRQVAIKVPNPQALLSPESRERFERESRAAATLCHPAIVPVFESGRVGPISYIAYQYCPGKTLAQWFHEKNKIVSPTTAAMIVSRLADAVQHAHQRGIIHRDLKPGNVLVKNSPSSNSESEDFCITDFGLAKFNQTDSDKLTVEGAIVGTPAYMSPEQALGHQEIDGQTDVFSLGVILYELLTGKLPFAGQNQLSTLRLVENHSPISPRKLRPGISKDLEAICFKALAKSKHERYLTAYELAADLNCWLESKPISARHDSNWQRLNRWVKKNPTLTIAWTTTFLCLIVGVTLTTLKWLEANTNYRQSQVHLNQSLKQEQRANHHLEKLDGSIGFVIQEFEDYHATHGQLSKRDLKILQKFLHVQYEIAHQEDQQELDSPARLMQSAKNSLRIANLEFLLRKRADAVLSAGKGLELLELIKVADDVQVEFIELKLELLLSRAQAELKTGQEHHFRDDVLAAAELLEKHKTLWNDEEFVRWRLKILKRSVFTHVLTENAQQEKYLEQIFQCAQQVYADKLADRESQQAWFFELAQCAHLSRPRSRQGKKFCLAGSQQQTFLKSKNWLDKTTQFSELKLQRAWAKRYVASKNYPLAKSTYLKVWEMGNELIKSEPQNERYLEYMAPVSRQLASLYYKMGDVQAADKHNQQAIELALQVGTSSWRSLILIRSNLSLGKSHLEAGKLDQASQYFEQSLEWLEKTVASPHINRFSLRSAFRAAGELAQLPNTVQLTKNKKTILELKLKITQQQLKLQPNNRAYRHNHQTTLDELSQLR